MANEPFENRLKQPDEFESFFGRVFVNAVQRRTQVLIGLVALVVIAIAAVIWNLRAEKKNLEASGRLAQVLSALPKDKANASDWESFLKDLDGFLAADSASSEVGSAKLYRGKALLMLGRDSEAVSTYEQAARVLPKPARYLAEEGEGLGWMEQKRWDEAEGIWTRLSEASDNPSQAFHAWNLGLTQEAAKRTSQALKTYQEFERKYPDSKLIEQVRSRLLALRQVSPTP
jgi:tetratricopeptide (TPR) repeat protein